MEEARIRRAILDIEAKLFNVRTLISRGDYEKIGEALELETFLVSLENNLINLIETGTIDDPELPPILPDEE